MSATNLAAPAPSRVRASILLCAVGAVGLACLIVVVVFPPSNADAAGSEWTPQQMIGPPYTGTTFSERFRYVNPQILPFADGTAAVIWTEANGPNPGIRGRHTSADGTPTGDAYVVWHPPEPEGTPYLKLAPLTENLGVAVMDTIVSSTDRIIRARLIGPNGPTGAAFDLSAATRNRPAATFDVASNGDGTATVAWADYDGTSYSVKERQVDASGASGPLRTISEPIARPENTIATNSVEVRGHGDGTASVAWAEQPSATVNNLNVRRVGSTGFISSIHQIVSRASRPPRIAAHPDGSVTAVWGEPGNWHTDLYVTKVSANGEIDTPERVCVAGQERSAIGLHCLDIDSGNFGAAFFRYDIVATGNGTSAVVARRPTDGDVVSWRVDNQGQAGPRTTLEASPGSSGSPEPQIIRDDKDNAVAMWTGNMPSSTLPALRAARIGSDNMVIGDQTLFPLTNRGDSAQVLAGPAPTGSSAGRSIWGVWSDWTANPSDDPATTRQVYAARYPRIVTQVIRPTRMIAFGDSYSSGQGLLEEVGLSYNCGTDMKKARYRKDTTVLAKYFWTSTDCDTRTLSSVQPSNLYRRGIAVHENMCHRHGRAYPNQLRSTFSVASKNFLFLACSGATTEHVGLLKKKVAQYPNSPANVHGGKTQVNTATPFASGGEPDLVTIGIGGNDAGFDEIIERCLRGDCLDPVFQSGAMAQINGTTFHRLAETFNKLRTRYPYASVLAFGYPRVIGDPDKPCGKVDIRGVATISRDELEWLKSAVEPALNSAVSDAAAHSGVAYIDIQAATRGHELCSDTDDRWINGIVPGDDIDAGPLDRIAFESFHPNQKAHDAIARYFVDHYTDGLGGLLVSSPAFKPLKTSKSGDR